MYYDIANHNIVADLPVSCLDSNGNYVIGLEFLDDEGLFACGYCRVDDNSPAQPPNTVEDVSSRQVTVNGFRASLVKTWMAQPVFVPPQVSARQVRLWLIDNNISLASVDAAIDSMADETLKEKTRVEWEFAPYIERTHPLIDAIGMAIGLTAAQIDNAFIQASQL